MLGGRLDTRLGRVRKQASRNTQEYLSPDYSIVGGPSTAATEANEKSKGYHEETSSEQDEGFESPDPEDDKTDQHTGDDGRKTKSAHSVISAAVTWRCAYL